ncbi:MAG: PqqD family protein [Clostridia bacterium]|nr:PqqD family protein [Clostridia bacterium]
MKIKEGFLLRQVGGNHVLVPVGAQSVDFRCIITLNEVGVFLWQRMVSDCTVDSLVEALLGEYDVQADVAHADVERFVASLREKNMLDE